MLFQSNSSLNERPTAGQIRAITRLAMALKLPVEEYRPSTRWEARDLQFDLLNRIRRRNNALLQSGKRKKW